MYEVRIIHDDNVGSCGVFGKIEEIHFKIDGEVILKDNKGFIRVNSNKVKCIKIVRK